MFTLHVTCCTSSHLPVTISPPLFSRTKKSLFGVPNPIVAAAALQTERAETFEALPEGRVGEAVNEAVTEAVTNSQPCGKE